MESEIQALNSSMRVLRPLHRVLIEIASVVGLQLEKVRFEDNNGTHTLHYYHVEWHWFWSHAGKDVMILVVDTKLQLSDCLLS
jgi:hypothetical protein